MHQTEDKFMKFKQVIMALAAVWMTVLTAAGASAQVGRIEGDVKKEGSDEPIVGALVDIVRTDIKGDYPVKSDKKGHFLHAGVPYSGKYTLLVSAEGFQATFYSDIRPTGEPITIKLSPGDGKRLTIEDLKKAQAAVGAAVPGTGGTSATGGGAGAKAAPPAKNAAEVKKQQEEFEKAKAANEKAKGDFENMKKKFAEGLDLAKNKNYDGAITAFKDAVVLDPEQHVVHANLALALYNRGATQMNAGQKDPAKQDFNDSVQAANKAIALVEPQVADPQKGAEAKKNKSSYLKIRADSESVLGMRLGDGAAAEAAAKDYREAASLTDDAEAKKQYELKAANTLFESGKSEEAIKAYTEILQSDPNSLDGLYKLGLAYAGAGKFQDSANTLQKFLDHAPENDARVPEVKAVIKDLVVGNNLTPPKAEPAKGGSKSAAGAKRKP
jgi:tetratricopeptide (TPR) repeat protein